MDLNPPSFTGEPNSDTQHQQQASHVTVKAPQFSEQNAAGWFPILEAQFALANMSNTTTQFYQCLSAIPPSVVLRLPGEVVSGRCYEDLKKAILNLVESSKPEIFESLLRSEELVGRPSACLSVLQKTAAKVGIGEDFVRHKFLNSLPANITPVLAASTTLSIAQLGNLADELMSFANVKPTCSNVQQVQHQPPPQNQRQSRNRTSSEANTIHPTARPFFERQRPKICRSHIYYGRQARNCREWCGWPDKKSCAIQPNSRPNSPAPVQRLPVHCSNDHPNDRGTR